jgi:hypothetical protein
MIFFEVVEKGWLVDFAFEVKVPYDFSEGVNLFLLFFRQRGM